MDNNIIIKLSGHLKLFHLTLLPIFIHIYKSQLNGYNKSFTAIPFIPDLRIRLQKCLCIAFDLVHGECGDDDDDHVISFCTSSAVLNYIHTLYSKYLLIEAHSATTALPLCRYMYKCTPCDCRSDLTHSLSQSSASKVKCKRRRIKLELSSVRQQLRQTQNIPC